MPTTDEGLMVEEAPPEAAASEDSTADASGRAAPVAARSGVPVLPWALAGVFLVLAVAMAVVAARVNDERDVERGDRRNVASVAGQVSEALLTLDYQDPDAQRDRLRELATGDLIEEYEGVLPGLQAFVSETQGATSVTVKDTFVGDIEAGEARVIVVSDLAVDSASGRRQLNNVYTLVYLKNLDGDWKADRVDSLNFGTGSGPLDQPAATTTTSAPTG